MNNIGPMTLPCGIPLVTGAGLDFAPFTTTHCCLAFRNAWIQLRTLPWMPYDSIFVTRRRWGTESKAFMKSMKTMPILSPASRVSVQVSITSRSWVVQDLPCTKPLKTVKIISSYFDKLQELNGVVSPGTLSSYGYGHHRDSFIFVFLMSLLACIRTEPLFHLPRREQIKCGIKTLWS